MTSQPDNALLEGMRDDEFSQHQRRGSPTPPGTSPDPAPSIFPWQDLIAIDTSAREIPVSSLKLSGRLIHLFQYAGIRCLGDLHGRSFTKLAELRNCGRITIQQLHQLLASPAVTAQQPVPRLAVPPPLRPLRPSELLSPRLAHALQRNGIQCLGDLHGMSLDNAHRLHHCGPKMRSELFRFLQRVAEQPPPLSTGASWSENLVQLLQSLEQAVAHVPPPLRSMLLRRLGATKDQRVWTFRRLAHARKTSTAAVANILPSLFRSIRRAAGPSPAVQLKQLAALCQRDVCPLTVPLLSHWLANKAVTSSLPLKFYLRLFAKLEPGILAWPDGQQPAPNAVPRHAPLRNALKSLLRAEPAGLPCKQALERLQAQQLFRDLPPKVFLGALHHAPTLVVTFPEPDQPHVCLSGLKRSSRKPWTQAQLGRLGTMSDSALARRLQCPAYRVAYKRKSLHIPPFQPPIPRLK